MTLSDNPSHRAPPPAPALYRLLAESAVSRAALDACGFPVALVDARATAHPFSYVNAAFERFFGYRAEDVLGKPPITLLFAQDERSSTLFEAAPTRVQLRARRADGSQLPVELSVGMVHDVDGRLTHWVLAFADRSEIERLRDELRLLRALGSAP